MLNLITTIILAIVGGLFWRMGGSGKYSRYWRRVGVASLLSILCFLRTYNYLSLLIFPLAYLPFTLGYGLPSKDDPVPSVLGKFFSKYIKGEFWLRIAVRVICGLSYGLNYVLLGYLTGNYISTVLSIALLTLSVPVVCSLKLKDVWEERTIGFLVLAYTLII